MTTDEIKKETWRIINNAASDIDISAEYLEWYATMPPELQAFALDVFFIMEELAVNKITAEAAKMKYDNAIAQRIQK